MSCRRRSSTHLAIVVCALALAPGCAGHGSDAARRTDVADRATDAFLQAKASDLRALLDPAFQSSWVGLATLPTTIQTLQEALGPCSRQGRGETIQSVPSTHAAEIRVLVACQGGRAPDMELDVLPTGKVAALTLMDGHQVVDVHDGHVTIGGSPL